MSSELIYDKLTELRNEVDRRAIHGVQSDADETRAGQLADGLANLLYTHQNSVVPHWQQPAAWYLRNWQRDRQRAGGRDLRNSIYHEYRPGAETIHAIGVWLNAKPRPPLVLEPADELINDKTLPNEQLAKMLGLPFHWMAAEIRYGRRKLPENFEENRPERRARKEAEAEEKKAFTEQVKQWHDYFMTVEAQAEVARIEAQELEWVPPPETIPELFAQEVPVWQIAKMHRVSEQEVWDAVGETQEQLEERMARMAAEKKALTLIGENLRRACQGSMTHSAVAFYAEMSEGLNLDDEIDLLTMKARRSAIEARIMKPTELHAAS